MYVGLVVYSLHLAVSTFPSKTAPSVDCHPGNANVSLWGKSEPTQCAASFFRTGNFRFVVVLRASCNDCIDEVDLEMARP